MKIIADQSDSSYWMCRAVEAIQTAQLTQDYADFENQLILASRLLTLCRVEYEHGRKTLQEQGGNAAGSKDTK